MFGSCRRVLKLQDIERLEARGYDFGCNKSKCRKLCPQQVIEHDTKTESYGDITSNISVLLGL